jgi:ketosteroid isomerase-like protein
MSEENVEVVEAMYRAFNDRDWEGLFHLTHPDIDWITDPTAPDSGTYSGRDGVTALLDSWLDTFDEVRAQLDSVRDEGDCVIITATLVGRLKGSDGEVNTRFAQAIRVRDGSVVAIRDYSTKAEALEAVGLSE